MDRDLMIHFLDYQETIMKFLNEFGDEMTAEKDRIVPIARATHDADELDAYIKELEFITKLMDIRIQMLKKYEQALLAEPLKKYFKEES